MRVLPAGPGKDQEELRRKVENGVRELWYFVRSEVKKLPQVETGAQQKHVDTLLQDLGHQQRLYTYTYTHQRCDIKTDKIKRPFQFLFNQHF